MDSPFGNMMTLDVRKKNVPLPWIKKKVLSLHTEDNNQMNKVVYNLFSNALKFTPSGGSVALAFRIEGNNVVISVADTGKGIPDSDKPNIFKRFYQSASNDSSQTGSGIGLHIASDYVQLHHGTISVSDNQPAGSIFTVTLPVTSGKENHGKGVMISQAHLYI